MAVNWSPAFEGALSVPEVQMAMCISAPHTRVENEQKFFFQNIAKQIAPFLRAAQHL